MSRGTLDPACLHTAFAYGAFTLSCRSSQFRSAGLCSASRGPKPRGACTPVWAPPVPLAATPGITVVFFSSGYLDVSVHRVPPACLYTVPRAFSMWWQGFPLPGFPIQTPMDQWTFAPPHGFSQLVASFIGS